MRPAVALLGSCAVAATAVLSIGCAEGEAGPGLAALGPAGLGEVASGCRAATDQGADAAALGLGDLRLQARGADLAALAALYERARDPAAARVAVIAAEGVGEVAGRDGCAEVAWARLAVAREGRVRLLPMTDLERVQLALGWAAFEDGRGPEARVAFTEASAPALPDGSLAVARSYLAEERFAEAAAAFQDVATRFPNNPLPPAGLAEALRRAGRRADAAAATARAIALGPRNLAFVRRAATDPFLEVHPAVRPPAVRLPDGRWAFLTQTTGAPETIAAAGDEAAAYATCKESFRTSAAVRAAAGGDPTSWRWSPAEESVCTAVWLRAYQAHRDAGRMEHEGLDDLLRVAKAGYLDERALFDVGAPAHPLATALLERDARERLVAFVAAHRVVPRRQGGWLF